MTLLVPFSVAYLVIDACMAEMKRNSEAVKGLGDSTFSTLANRIKGTE